MYAPTTRSQRAVRFAIVMAMVMAGALIGVPQAPPGLSPVGDRARPQSAEYQVLSVQVGGGDEAGGGQR